jgi:hypothetical protein
MGILEQDILVKFGFSWLSCCTKSLLAQLSNERFAMIAGVKIRVGRGMGVFPEGYQNY